MGQILTKTVDRAIQKGWIPESDRSSVMQKIQNLGNKYGFRPDDFAIFTHVESFGMKPSAWNSSQCAGIIQFCPSVRGSGIKRMGGRNYSTPGIRQMSVNQQLDLVDVYLNDVVPKSQRGSMSLDRLYFYVLFPAIGQGYNKYNDSFDLRTLSSALENQADKLYVGGSKQNPMTKISVRNGLLNVARANLGNDVISEDAGITSEAFVADVDPNDTSQFGNFGFQAGLINGNCDVEFPKEFTLKEALQYTGCASKIIGNAMGVGGLGFPSNGMRVNGASNFTIADFNPSVPICAGCLGHPFKTQIRITAPFCQQRTSSRSGNVYYHSGTDYGGPQGIEVVAVADGIVASPLIRGNGYEPGFVDIMHDGLGNLLSRSAHIIPGVVPGQRVKRGDVIGKVGPYPPGGPHLHLELRKDRGAGGSAFSIQQCKTKFLDPAIFCRRSP